MEGTRRRLGDGTLELRSVVGPAGAHERPPISSAFRRRRRVRRRHACEQYCASACGSTIGTPQPSHGLASRSIDVVVTTASARTSRASGSRGTTPLATNERPPATGRTIAWPRRQSSAPPRPAASAEQGRPEVPRAPCKVVKARLCHRKPRVLLAAQSGAAAGRGRMLETPLEQVSALPAVVTGRHSGRSFIGWASHSRTSSEPPPGARLRR